MGPKRVCRVLVSGAAMKDAVPKARGRPSSSAKSIAASTYMRSSSRRDSSVRTRAENSPCSERLAAFAAAAVPALIRSTTASACARSMRSLRNARSENSPGRASRAPQARQAATSRSITTGLPWAWSSSTSSPVNEAGAGDHRTRPLSRSSPVASRNGRRTGRRDGGSEPSRRTAMVAAPGPDNRTTPMPPRPGGVAIATIVSARLAGLMDTEVRNGGSPVPDDTPGKHRRARVPARGRVVSRASFPRARPAG